MEKKENKNGARAAAVQFICPHGSDKRKVYVWNQDKTALEEVGEVDIQAEIDEAAKGMNASEQIARIMRGDTSCIQPGEGFYGDVSAAPDSEIDAMANALAADNKLEAAAQDFGMEIAELKAKLAALEEKKKKQGTQAAPAALEEKEKKQETQAAPAAEEVK